MAFSTGLIFLRPLRTALARVGIAALVALALAAPASAAKQNWREIPPIGGAGNDAFSHNCKDEGYLIGIRVYMGAWVDHIDWICSTYNAELKWKQRFVDGYGGDGGNAKGEVGVCADGWVLEGLRIRFTKGMKQVHTILGTCRNIAANTTAGGGFALYPNDQQAAETEPVLQKITCRDTEAVSGLSGRYGKHVNALGLNCKKFPPEAEEVGPAPVTTSNRPIEGMIFCQGGGGMKVGTGATKLTIALQFKRAAQSSQAVMPGPGECAFSDRPITRDEPRNLYVPLSGDAKNVVEAAQKGGIFLVSVSRMSTGFWVEKVESADPNWRPQGASSNSRDFVKNRIARSKAKNAQGGQGLAADDGASFSGRWSAEAGGTTYDMTLQQDGVAVSGSFEGSDGSSANLSGKVKNNVLSFSFKQSDGVKGTGKFKLADNGGSFDGSYKVDGDTGVWNGTRQ